MAPPKRLEAQKLVYFKLAVHQEVAVAVRNCADRYDESVYRLLGRIVTRVFRNQVSSSVVQKTYRSHAQSSSATGVACQIVKGVSSAQLASTAPVVAGL